MKPSQKLRMYTSNEIPDHILETYDRAISDVMQRVIPILMNYEVGIYMNALVTMQAIILKKLFQDSPEELEFAVEDVFNVFLDRVYNEHKGVE